ncbi:MAG: c-type cytochrome [Acidimicrobiales bacterium]
MTEVPEHLLQRSRDRRKALGLGGDDDGGGDAAAPAAAGAATPAASAPAAPSLPAFDIEPAKPKPPAPTRPWVEAARKRKRIPYWVMPVLLFLPLWAFIYFGTLEEPEQGAVGLLGEGAEVYEAIANCAQCHGAGGAGANAGPQLNAGEVLITFPADPDGLGLAQMVEWVVKGTNGIGAGTPYGSPERGRVGGWFGVMPGFGESITAEELLAVVLYERVQHGMSAADETLATILLEQIEAGEIVLPENWPLDVTVADIQATLAPAFAATGDAETAGGGG